MYTFQNVTEVYIIFNVLMFYFNVRRQSSSCEFSNYNKLMDLVCAYFFQRAAKVEFICCFVLFCF